MCQARHATVLVSEWQFRALLYYEELFVRVACQTRQLIQASKAPCQRTDQQVYTADLRVQQPPDKLSSLLHPGLSSPPSPAMLQPLRDAHSLSALTATADLFQPGRLNSARTVPCHLIKVHSTGGRSCRTLFPIATHRTFSVSIRSRREREYQSSWPVNGLCLPWYPRTNSQRSSSLASATTSPLLSYYHSSGTLNLALCPSSSSQAQRSGLYASNVFCVCVSQWDLGHANAQYICP
jgi:hypothetical protein